MRKFLEPHRVYSVATSVRESDKEEYGNDMKACEKLFKSFRCNVSSVMSIPLFTAPLVREAMEKMIEVDDMIGFQSIRTENGNVVMSLSTLPAFIDQLERIKLDLYTKVDQALIERAKEFIKA